MATNAHGNVTALHDVDSATLEQAIAWSEVVGRQGHYNPETMRQAANAVLQFAKVLGESEPRVAARFLEDLDNVAERWLRLNVGKQETARTYKVKARLLLGEYVRYVREGTSFRPAAKAPKVKVEKEAKPRAEQPKAASPTPPPTTEPARDATPPRTEYQHRVPLGGGRFFRCAYDGELTFADTKRVSAWLASQSTDVVIEGVTVKSERDGGTEPGPLATR